MANAPLYQNLAQLDSWQQDMFPEREIVLTTTETIRYIHRGLLWVDRDYKTRGTCVHIGRLGDYVMFQGFAWITPDGIEMRIFSSHSLHHLEPRTGIYKRYLKELQERPELAASWLAKDSSSGWESYVKHRVASNTLGCSC